MRYLILLFLLVSCANLTEEEKEERQFEREYRYAETYENFLVRKQWCKDNNGVWIQRFADRKRRKPNIHDMKTAGCMRRGDFGRMMDGGLGW